MVLLCLVLGVSPPYFGAKTQIRPKWSHVVYDLDGSVVLVGIRGRMQRVH